MPRPRHPIPQLIDGLTFNIKLKCYTISEAKITYHMSLEHVRSLADNFRGAGYYQTGMIEEWFKKLDKKTQKEIYRSGIKDNTEYYHDGNATE